MAEGMHAKRITLTETADTEYLTCVICEDECIKDFVLRVGGYNMCGECFESGVKSQFEDALEHEHNYPVRMGAVQLEAIDFISMLGEDFVLRFHRRELEYRTPETKRRICQHQLKAEGAPRKGQEAPYESCFALSPNAIIGIQNSGIDIVACGAMVSNIEPTQINLQCYRCRGWICCYCDKALEYFGKAHDKCEKPSSQKLGLEGQGQVKGKDYQLCPECQVPIYLAEACNAMTCKRCRTQFCYICGKRASHSDRTHWTAGHCPRWSQPDGSNPIFDRAVVLTHPVQRPEEFGGGHSSLESARNMARQFVQTTGGFRDNRGFGIVEGADSVAASGRNDERHGYYHQQVTEEIIRLSNGIEAPTTHLINFLDRVCEVRAFVANDQIDPQHSREVLSGRRRADIQSLPLQLEHQLSDLDKGRIHFAKGTEPMDPATLEFCIAHNRMYRDVLQVGVRTMQQHMPLNWARFSSYRLRIPNDFGR